MSRYLETVLMSSSRTLSDAASLASRRKPRLRGLAAIAAAVLIAGLAAWPELVKR